MSLAREDATRIGRFCLAGGGWATAVEEEGRCVLRIGRSVTSGTEVRNFEGATYEEALRHAANAGVLKSTCVEKQISFLARALPERNPEVTPEALMVGSPARVTELFPLLTCAISALVHDTQVERGTSSLFLSSGGRLFGDELRKTWRNTDARRQEFARLCDRRVSGVAPALSRRLERAGTMLDEIEARRSEVAFLGTTPSAVIERYSTANSELLAVIDSLASSGRVDGTLQPTALAWMVLLHAMEKTGIERAHLSAAFSWDRFGEGQHAAVAGLIAARESYLHVFAAAAPRSVGELLRDALKSEVESAVSEMERVALDHREGGFGIDPAAWFASATRKIDLLGQIESAIRASLVPAQI
jgi:hypothetical protein